MEAILARSVVLVVGLVSVLAACSSSTAGDGGDGPGTKEPARNGSDAGDDPSDAQAGDAAPADPLTCLSHTWCGSGEVTRWKGQVLPTARGGAIPDGLYRQAYILSEKGKGTEFGDYEGGLQIRDGYLRTYGGLSKVGTFTAANGKLSVAYTANCDDGTGATGSASTAKDEIDYLVDARGQLFLFATTTGSAGAQTEARVYLPQQSFCGNLPKAVPTEPGDSFVCHVTNCGCTEADNGPASAQVCKFVHGGG
jgi:hypothetical protein